MSLDFRLKSLRRRRIVALDVTWYGSPEDWWEMFDGCGLNFGAGLSSED
jgi:hypothetical protein